MAKSKFINYFSYENLYGNVLNCTINPNKGQIKFRHHFTKNAKIQFILNFDDRGQQHKEAKEDSLGGNTNITKDGNNVYTFSAKNFPEDQRDFEFLDFLNFQIMILEGSQTASITFNNTDNILEKELLYQGYNNIFFRFSYNVNDANCKQFNNCILHIGQEINSNITYTNWISPIASGKDISVIVESSLHTDESGYQLFNGSLEKCIKALDSTKWTSAFYKKNQNTGTKGNYNGTFKVNPSKTYSRKELVRFQDIDLSSIGNTNPPATPM